MPYNGVSTVVKNVVLDWPCDCDRRVCVCLSQNKLLAVERDRLDKELELLREDSVGTKAKNSELERENRELERALCELREQSKCCVCSCVCLLVSRLQTLNAVYQSLHYH